MQQDGEIADLARHLVREHGEPGHDAEVDVDQECCGDEHTIERVVHGVADEDHHPRRTLVVVVIIFGSMRLAMILVAMPPEHELLEHEEQCDASEQ